MKTSRKSLFVISILILAICLALGKLVAQRMLDYLDHLDTQISAESEKLETARTELTNNVEFVEKWQQINGFKNDPIERRLTDFSDYLNTIGMELNYIFDEFTSPTTGRPVPEHDEFQTLSFTLRFSTDLKNLVEFLDRLDLSKQLHKIENLEITKDKSSLSALRDARYESSLPSTRDKDLTVKITISIPAATPAKEANPEEG